MSENLTIPEVIAYLDEHERDLERMRGKVRELRRMLFAAYQAEGIDTEVDDLLD